MTNGPSSDLAGANLPPVVWDGLGLSNPYSGVAHAAMSLRREIVNEGVVPFVTMCRRSVVAEVPANNRLIADEGVFRVVPYGLTRLKPLFPCLSYRRARDLAPNIIFHGLSNFNLPGYGSRRPKDKFVLTVHDLIPLLVAPNSALGLQMRWLLPRALDRADAVISISNWTRDLLCERYGERLSSKISVIYNGTPKNIDQRPREKKFDFLVVSRGEPYKRLSLARQISTLMPECKFAVVTDLDGLRQFAGAGPNVTLFRSLSDDGLERLFNESDLLLQTSLYEGWCLPAANALSKGLRVAYTKGSGIDEVCEYFRSRAIPMERLFNANDWVDRLRQVSRESNILEVEAHLPTWAESAQKTLRIYKSLV